MSTLPFEDRRLLPNPFGRAVGDPLEDTIDIPEINQQAFDACLSLLAEVKAQRASAAITITGEPGTGKTHLLGRVRRWLQTSPHDLFVPVRMDTTSRMLWRHLRRNLADALLRDDPSGQRALDRILAPKRAAIAAMPERDLSIVLEHLLDGSHLRDAAAWLRGQELPESARMRLDLAEPGDQEEQESLSRNAIAALCSLIEPGVVVLCLDQWEAIQGAASGSEGIIAAGQAVSFLHDPPLRNLSIICCVQSGFTPTLEKLLDVAIQQRLLTRRQHIRPLDWDMARRLISARLQQLPLLSQMQPPPQNPLWPLPEQPIRQVFQDNLAPARKVIFRCKDLFDYWCTNQEEPVESFDAFMQRMLERSTKPVEAVDAEQVLRNGLPLLLNTLGTARAMDDQSPIDFSLNNGQQLIAICNQSNPQSLAARMRHIAQSKHPQAGQRLLLLRDARLPVSPTATATQKYLRTIEEKGGRLVPVSQEAVQALAALRRLLADAQSGDLACRGETVPPTKVIDWIASHLPASFDPLLSEIEVPDLLSHKLADLLARHKIISLTQAAQELQVQTKEVEACARLDPRLFGVLGGSHTVLFQPVTVESAAAPAAN